MGDLVSRVEDYAIFTLDRRGIILDWNLGGERMTGYTAVEIVGEHFSRFYTEEERAAGMPVRELETAEQEGHFADEGWRMRKDGSRFWASVAVTAIRDAETGAVIRMLKIVRDLTERMLATRALKHSEERFRLLVESASDYAIFMLDPEGHVMSWNAGARRIKGYEQAEIVGRHFSTFYPPESLALHLPEVLLRRALADGRVEDEGWRVRKDGTRFWGNVVISALRGDDGELRGFAKITRDMTARREINQLQESGRRKDAFLATLAHELRNPLAPLLPALEIILASAADPARVAAMAAMMRRQVEQMSHLIDDLLDVSRITTGKIVLKRSPSGLRDVVDSAVETVRPMIDLARHEFELDLPGHDVSLDVDPHRLSQIIANLLGNASKYTPPGNGKIVLAATVESGDLLRISVKDNGKGISPALQGKIFDLFDQGMDGSEDGLGIGLTLVRSLVEMHGGSVSVSSEGVGQGSEFIVLLPVVLAQGVGITEATTVVSIPEKPPIARVLVADDGKSAADVLVMFFEMEGLETAVAYDGLQAVERAAAFKPDLVLLDIGMPRLDGLEAARRIRKLAPDIALVALSGWGTDDDRKRTAEAGFDLHLVKPVKPEDLRAVISRFLTRVSVNE